VIRLRERSERPECNPRKSKELRGGPPPSERKEWRPGRSCPNPEATAAPPTVWGGRGWGRASRRVEGKGGQRGSPGGGRNPLSLPGFPQNSTYLIANPARPAVAKRNRQRVSEGEKGGGRKEFEGTWGGKEGEAVARGASDYLWPQPCRRGGRGLGRGLGDVRGGVVGGCVGVTGGGGGGGVGCWLIT